MFDWNGVGQMPSFMPGTGQVPSQMQGAYQPSSFQGCCGAQQSFGPCQMTGQGSNQQFVSGQIHSQMPGAYGMSASSNLHGVSSVQNGGAVGGLTPQMSLYQDVLKVLPMLGPQQLSMVRQFVNEGMRSRFRSVPESFGENPVSNAGVHSGERFAQSETMGPTLPLSGGYDGGSYGWAPQDVIFKVREVDR